MPHQWIIRKDRAGEFRASFEYNGEKIWRTEGYTSKASAQNAIMSAIKNAPSAPTIDETPDELEPFRSAEAPSSDTIIRIDRQSAEFKEFQKALIKFADTLRTANDLQALDADDLEIARHEMEQIKDASSKRVVRAASLWSMTKTTTIWVASKAADGTIKALAVALLAAAAKLLGVHF